MLETRRHAGQRGMYQELGCGDFTPPFNGEDKCVGFFAFLWGWKWEKTGTWFGLLDTWTAAGGIPSGNSAVQNGSTLKLQASVVSRSLSHDPQHLTGYLNDVAQPMLDEISPDWAWPMKLRCLWHLRGNIVTHRHMDAGYMGYRSVL